MNDHEKIIESLRQQLQSALKKVSALEQENTLLEDEIRRLKKAQKRPSKKGVL